MRLWQRTQWFMLIGALSLVLTSCALPLPGDAPPVLKIGLIAPFEGLGRPLGYAVLPVVQDALAQANASGALGTYRLLLVALNDQLDPSTAATQVRVLAQDPDLIAIIGPFTQATADAASSEISHVSIPWLAPPPLTTPLAGGISLCPPAEAIASVLAGTAVGENTPSCSHWNIKQMNIRMIERVNSDWLCEEAGLLADAVPDTFFPGDAAEAADRLIVRRKDGWTGDLRGGPDVLKPWFIGRAGAEGEGTRAVACTVGGAEPGAGELPEVALAREAAGVIIRGLAAQISAGRTPTRNGLAAQLANQRIQVKLLWYEVRADTWQPMEVAEAQSPRELSAIPPPAR